MAYGNGDNTQTNLTAKSGEFINRRTGQPIPPGTFYHIHPEKGPMEGPTHNPNIPGGTAGHDYFDAAMSKGGRTTPVPQKKNEGGYLLGPSHEAGGIPAIVGGTTPIELEGSEYIINGKATAALGTQFLDKLNATANDYHPNVQGFGPNELPAPSQFELGGRINYQSRNGNSMKRGGNIPSGVRKLPIQRKLQEGGQMTCPPGMVMRDGACFQMTGNPNQTEKGYLRKIGGNVTNKSVSKKQTGGLVTEGSNRRPGMRALRKLKDSRKARNKIGTNTRTTSVDNNHSHIVYVNENNDGKTNSGPNGHVHRVVNGRLLIDCSDGCHTHS